MTKKDFKTLANLIQEEKRILDARTDLTEHEYQERELRINYMGWFICLHGSKLNPRFNRKEWEEATR